MPDLVLGGRRTAAGSRAIVRLPVAHDLTGAVDIAAHVVAGRHDGPTLLLLSMLHGNEWFSALAVRDVLARIDPATLKGAVIAVTKNELLARVIDPLTFETVDEVRSPGRGVIFYACRAHMVRPGGWAFGVANLEDDRTEWI